LSEDEVNDYERVLGVSLPQSYRDSLLIHRGVEGGALVWDSVNINEPNVAIGYRAICIREFTGSSMKGVVVNAVGPVQTILFDPLWVQVADDNGLPICIDLNPALGGRLGQVIFLDPGISTVSVVAGDFAEFLELGLGKMRKMAVV
jgi:cell wall assembly regulator SMI1